MEYIKIRNWERWQSYRKDRGQPPWIKVHRELLRNVEWVSLSDSERGQLVAIWLLAADHNGVIPASAVTIQKLCFMTKAPNLKKFTELGFLEPSGCHSGCQGDAKVTPTGCQYDAPEESRDRVETETETDMAPHDAKKSTAFLLGTFQNVKLTEEEHRKLISQFGEASAGDRIDRLGEYLASSGKRYKSHYATILSWARKDNGNGKQGDNTGHGSPFLDAIRAQRDSGHSGSVGTGAGKVS